MIISFSEEQINHINKFCSSDIFIKVANSKPKDFRDKNLRSDFYFEARNKLSSLVGVIDSYLNNPNYGMIAFDVPDVSIVSFLNKNLLDFYISHAISSLFMEFELDIKMAHLFLSILHQYKMQ